MTIGMLWFDNDPKRSLETKIQVAAAYYVIKYAKKANQCYVHPVMVAQGTPAMDGIEIKTSRQVLPNHIWLGVKDE